MVKCEIEADEAEVDMRIVDVARYAGVSTATVSRVLNGKDVRADLAEAVRDAVAELGYSPDRTARSLRRRHSDLVALVLPDVENPFFTSVARGVEDIAQAAGYSVVLCNSDDLPDKEERYLTVAEHENMAGVVVAPASERPALGRLLVKRRGVVVIDRTVDLDVDQVTFDNLDLGRRAAGRLVDRGFRRIACITGPLSVSTAVDRAAGWRGALTEAGLPAPDDLVVHTNFRVDGGYAALAGLLDRADPPDAVLATNNLVGIGALRALADRHGVPAPDAERGAKAPSGRSIGVGIIGDLPSATSRTTDVALVELNPRGMGITAARLLLERIDGLDEPARHIVQNTGP